MPKISSKPILTICPPPFAVQVELTEGCNLRCSFCGLNGIRGKENNFKFMSIETAADIACKIRTAKWNPRVEFAMHGEPSANPNMLTILSVFRHALPNCNMMMTSNGYGFLKDPTNTVDGVLEYVNILALDWYDNVLIVPKIIDKYEGRHKVRYYPDEPSANPHARRRLDEADFVIIRDISSSTKGTHSKLNNHCGAGAPKNDDGQGKVCAKPFRELSIRWDGNVALCCNDWRGEYKIGNVKDRTLEDLWQSKPFWAARKKLYIGDRKFGACDGCDSISYRVGLLPDKKGLYTLPKPNAEDDKTIQQATSGSLLALPILRSWEVSNED
jgi:radical SAM protein with 4Fe4S-binding SPASM domain